MIGTTLGHYRILEQLGEGGMGVVYKAQDLHLDRPVALKVLPPEKVADPDRKRRFVQEAKAASALNHPHIVTIHDIDQADGTDFIAMEYVAGTTLDQRIGHHGMRLNEALKYAVQIADALAKAHAAGIVHRDLKPTNIMVSADGVVKVLDFGLAKLTEPDLGDEAVTATVRAEGKPLTEQGTIVGTVAYMSPEQAEGKPVDARSDIFSLGSVLYELVTGQQPFQGPSKLSTLSAILKEEPKPLSTIAPAVPHDLEKLITRCLRKDPAKRFQHMDDVKVALEELKEESDSGKLVTAGPMTKRGFRWGWALAVAAAALVVAASGWFLFVRREGVLPPPRLIPLTSYPGSEGYPALSPDGTQVAFSWNGEKEDNYDIYVQVIGEAEARRLTHDPAVDTDPVWSPDGARLAFRRGTSLYTMSASTGTEQKVTDVPNLTGLASWSPDEKWLAVSRGRPAGVSVDDPTGIYLVPVRGGDWERVTTAPAPATDGYPHLSRDGRLLAFARNPYPGVSSDLFLQSLSSDGQPEGSPRQLTTTGALIVGLAWHRDRESIVVGRQVAFMLSYLYRVFLDGRTPMERIELAGSSAYTPTTSPGRDRLAFSQRNTNWDIWRVRPGGATEPLIRNSMQDYAPEYSPDGSRIAFTSNRNGESCEVYLANADGTNVTPLTDGPGRNQGTARWSPTGRWIAFDSQDATGQMDIYVIDASGGQPRRITSEPSDENLPSWSGDGQWVYFESNRTGRREIWRAPFAGGPSQQMTTEGGQNPRESTDGRTLFYRKGTSELFAKAVTGGPERRLTGGVVSGFSLVEKGIYYWGPRGTDGEFPLVFFDLASGKSTEVARLAAATMRGAASVSPDGQSVLCSPSLVGGNDLKLIENFR